MRGRSMPHGGRRAGKKSYKEQPAGASFTKARRKKRSSLSSMPPLGLPQTGAPSGNRVGLSLPLLLADR